MSRAIKPYRGPMPTAKTPPAPPPLPPTWRRALSALYRGWMKIAHVLAWINTRILLGIVFLLFLLPARLIMTVFGRDPLSRKIDPKKSSYWIERDESDKRRPADDYEHQY